MKLWGPFCWAIRGAIGDPSGKLAFGSTSEMKIAILSTAEVRNWYLLALQERGHEVEIVDGYPPSVVKSMIKDRFDGILILSDGDEIHEEIAARFTRATGRPVWRNLTEIPRARDG